jgi:hypothetical protein
MCSFNSSGIDCRDVPFTLEQVLENGEKQIVLKSLLIHYHYNGKYRRDVDWPLQAFPLSEEQSLMLHVLDSLSSLGSFTLHPRAFTCLSFFFFSLDAFSLLLSIKMAPSLSCLSPQHIILSHPSLLLNLIHHLTHILESFQYIETPPQ